MTIDYFVSARRAVIAAMLLIATGAPLASASSLRQVEDVRTMRIEGSIVVDAAGKVVSYAIKTELHAPLLALLDKAIPTWAFEPGAPRHGELVARTGMELELVARGSGRDWDVRISQVQFPDANREMRVASVRTERRHLHIPGFEFNGAAVVALKIGRNGEILDTASVICTLFDSSTSLDIKARQCSEFERYAARAVKRWKLTVDGDPGVSSGDYITGHTTIGFHAYGRRTSGSVPGKWRLESRTTYRDQPWERTTLVADLNSGNINRSTERLRLREGVVGFPP